MCFIAIKFFVVVLQGSQYLAGLQETQNEKGEDSINAMPSYLQVISYSYFLLITSYFHMKQ